MLRQESTLKEFVRKAVELSLEFDRNREVERPRIPGMDDGGRPCPACERPMIHRHCKYVCPEHGVVYDCSDTFY